MCSAHVVKNRLTTVTETSALFITLERDRLSSLNCRKCAVSFRPVTRLSDGGGSTLDTIGVQDEAPSSESRH